MKRMGEATPITGAGLANSAGSRRIVFVTISELGKKLKNISAITQ
jgi:hypothetical protein